MYLSAELEKLQKRVMRIIYPFTPYSDALAGANLEKLSERRAAITANLFDTISRDRDDKLRHLLPPSNNCSANLSRKGNSTHPDVNLKGL